MIQVSEHLKNLNPEQLEAVTTVDGPLLVFAGAGSGKTRVLTRRIAHLVLTQDVAPERILAVTFTNKAAREMKERVAGLFSRERPPSWVSTFHSMCVRILRTHAEMLDYSKRFVIYDDGDSQGAMKRVFKRKNIDSRLIEPRAVMSQIDRAKNEYLFPDDLRKNNWARGPQAELIAELYESYQRELKTADAMDFGDLICNVVTLFRLAPDVLQQYQEHFRYFLIDEYQDTNRVQYQLIRLLTEENHNLCVVGDDDQSIYAFRGATIENILNFKRDFPEAKIITLSQNYRSTKTILNAAQAVISKNTRRQDKQLRTENEAGEKISFFKGEDERDEAEFVAREVLRLVDQGVNSSEIAIFYRTNALSRALEECLLEYAIPYVIIGGRRFYERKEIKDILAYAKLSINPRDNESFLRIINTPTRGLGANSINNLIKYADESKLSLFEALREGLKSGASSFISTANKNRFREFHELISGFIDEAVRVDSVLLQLAEECRGIDDRTQILAHFLNTLAHKSQYLSKLDKEETPEAEARKENIMELLNVAVEFVRASIEEGLTPSIVGFLDRANLATDQENDTSSQGENAKKFTGPVLMMTLHLAKGLEFNSVFMVGLEEGLLPHVRSLDNPRESEEERRLCYVGITRARKKLFISCAADRQAYRGNSWFGGIPSRFLRDIPVELISGRNHAY
ncbi:UvrD-helicase domain-containing protein [bacterium]|nr:UvrD-helicase domain-containing protein [bacterium]